jgi:RimJ/RimL family protein N-acetyltransferase
MGTFASLKRITPGKLVRHVLRLFLERVEFRIYRRRLIDGVQAPAAGVHIHCDNVDDLAKFRPSAPWQDRDRALADWRTRLEHGNHVYTVASESVLLHYGWLIPEAHESVLTEVGQRFRYPPRSAVLYDFYTDPDVRGGGLYQATLRRMLADLAAEGRAEFAYISVLADNAPSRHVIEKLGFSHVGSFFRVRRLGRTRNWTTLDAAASQVEAGA